MRHKAEVCHTKVAHIKYFGAPILSHARKQLTVSARRDRYYWNQMGAVMLDELDSLFLLLPKLQMSVNGSGDQEFSSGCALSISRR